MTYAQGVPLTQDIGEDFTSILIISKSKTEFTTLLETQLHKSRARIDHSSAIPERLDKYDFYFFVDQLDFLPDRMTEKHNNCIFIYFKSDEIAQLMTSYAYSHEASRIKVINLDSSPEWYSKDVETILWFIFTSHDDIFLHLYHPLVHKAKTTHTLHTKKILSSQNRYIYPRSSRSIILILFLFVLFFHILFIFPLLTTSLLNYQMFKLYQQGKPLSVSVHTITALNVTKKLFRLAEPTLRLLNIVGPFEDLIILNEAAIDATRRVNAVNETGRKILTYMTGQQTFIGDPTEIKLMKKALFHDLRAAMRDVQIISDRLPEWLYENKKVSEKIKTYTNIAPDILQWEPFLDSLFAADGKRTYLLLFANNMELRPGGGFIGSFALVDVQQYHIKNIKTYDVYDADGQLTEHINAPEPLARYLNQPRWFLRDSAFSPDFSINFEEAKRLLEKEMGVTNIDGGILITTTAVQRILEATGPIYIPDYQEEISAENFYLKTQLHAERNFFPGSLEKKSFLSALINQLLIGVKAEKLPDLIHALSQSLDEKQVVLTVNDSDIRSHFEKRYWSGRILQPTCQIPAGTTCIVDYLFPVDANLGVNKANFFMRRPMQLEIQIDETGTISNTLTLSYRNNSKPEIFPGGPYKNYFQLYLAPNSTVERITIDGELANEVKETNGLYKVIEFYFETLPESTKTISIKYTLPTSILKGEGVYQLIFQKQIGSAAEDLGIQINLPDNLILRKSDFSPLVMGKKINYNTSISSDKIIVIEFQKQ